MVRQRDPNRETEFGLRCEFTVKLFEKESDGNRRDFPYAEHFADRENFLPMQANRWRSA
jgi:hypothetical protein